MDATEVSVCSQEERRFGELVERLHCKNTVAFLSAVCVYLYFLLCGFRLQEQSAEREGLYEHSAESH